MSQSTKLFLVLGFLFILYTTMKGNLQRYVAILFGGNPGRISPTDKVFNEVFDRLDEARKGIFK